MSRGVERYAGHKDVCVPPGRKIDPVGIDTAWLRERAANPTATEPQPGVEILERVTVTPPDAGENIVRVFLSGSPAGAIVVRPRLGGDGFARPMWVSNIYAWGSDRTGVGHNPAQLPGHDPKLTSHRRYDVPGAVWADVRYSAAEPFEIDLVG